MAVELLGPNVSGFDAAATEGSMTVFDGAIATIWCDGLLVVSMRFWSGWRLPLGENIAFRDVPISVRSMTVFSLENRLGVHKGLYRRFPTVSDGSGTAAATDICEIVVFTR